MYPKGKELIAGSGNLTSDTIKLRLLTSTYSFNPSHQFLSDVGSGVGTDQQLGVSGDTGQSAGVTVTGGVLDAARDPKWTAVATGSTVTRLVAYVDTGTASTSTLLCYVDTGPSGALNIPTNGGDITIVLDNGTVITGLFAI
jgi:hypothetical protein